ncbi:MAG: hypothetical protein IAG13_33750, partial [Deltaproteobacteria bacterium]|nr:hypothetical protein [Nannocystaceae bacterium]
GVSAGSGTLHFHVRLGAAPKHAKGPALAVRQRAPKDAVKLAMPAPVAITVLGEDALVDITRTLTAKLDVDQRKLLRRHPLRPKHVEVFAGRFPGGRTHAIIVRLAVPDEDPVVSGVLFAKQDGSVELVAISGVWGELEMFAMVDLDGDGIDELVYEDAYHEGWYLQLLYWKKGAPKIRTLTGDGV